MSSFQRAAGIHAVLQTRTISGGSLIHLPTYHILSNALCHCDFAAAMNRRIFSASLLRPSGPHTPLETSTTAGPERRQACEHRYCNQINCYMFKMRNLAHAGTCKLPFRKQILGLLLYAPGGAACLTVATFSGVKPPARTQPRLPQSTGGARRLQSNAMPLPPCIPSISTHSTCLRIYHEITF